MEFRALVNGKDVARARQRDVKDALDLARPSTHDDDLVGKRDSFGEIMRDEENGFSLARPKIEQLLLHHQACLGVQRDQRARPSE